MVFFVCMFGMVMNSLVEFGMGIGLWLLIEGWIEFENIIFNYLLISFFVLDCVNIVVFVGKVVGIVGCSGLGKIMLMCMM